MFERAKQIMVEIADLKREWGSMFACEFAQKEYAEKLQELAGIAMMCESEVQISA